MNFKVSSFSKPENNYTLQKNKQDKKQLSFKGLESVGALANCFFTQVQTNKIFEYAFLDVASMAAPRTIVDFTRNKDTGIETGCREFSSTIINTLTPGLIAVGVGNLLGKIINPKLKLKTGLPINSSALETLKDAWTSTNPATGQNYWSKGANKQQFVQNFVENVLNRTEVLVGEEWASLAKKPQDLKNISGSVAQIILKDGKVSSKEYKKAGEQFVKVFGASENLRIAGQKSGAAALETTADRVIRNMVDTGRNLFTKVKPDEIDSAVNKMIKTSKTKSLITLGIVISMAFSQQFINKYITKLRTGKDGFVGVSEDSKNEEKKEGSAKKSKLGFRLAKVASVAGIWSIAASTISGSINPKQIWKTFTSQKIIKKLEYNSMFPHVNQLRAVYATMLTGRMLAARDKHELRETDIRDYSGFLNWLVLGGFVSKGVGKLISNGEILNGPKPPEKAGFFKKFGHLISKNSLVSHAEIDARKMSVEKATEILTKAKRNIPVEGEKIILEAKNLLKGQLNKSIGMGLAYSTLALGLFMPMLNKYITNKITGKKKTEENSKKPAVSGTIAFSNPASQELFADFIKTHQKLKKA